MSGAQSLTGDVDIDIRGLLSAVWRKKLLLVLATLIGGGLLFAALGTISPRYKSDAQILITKRESVFTRIPTNDTQPNGPFDEQAVNSQVLILSSDDLAAKVIKQLGLEEHSEFQEEPGGLLSLAASLLKSPEDNAPVAGAPSPELAVSPAVLKKFKEQLTVYSADKSRVIVVEFWSKDRRLARDVPNTLAKLYLETTRDATLESDSSATDWLGPEIDKLRKSVEAAEAKAADFRAQSDILIGNNNALLATQQLSEVSSELSRVRGERSGAEARVDTIRSALANGGSLDVIPEVISSPLIQRLRERQVTTQAQISELSSTLLPNHPRIKSLKSQLPEVDRQIRKAATDILKSLEGNVERLRKQEEVLLQEMNRYKSESARVGEAEVELRALEREANAQRERLEGYLVRYNEAESRQNSGYVPSEAKIIEHAVLPADSYFPKVVPFTVAGMTALFLLMVVGILAVELLSGRAFKPVGAIRPEDVPLPVEPVAAPSLAPAMDDLLRDEMAAQTAPGIAMEPTPANDADAFPPEFALQAITAMGHAAIAIVNPAGGEENAIFAAAIARNLSQGGKRVAVVDFTGEGITARHMLGDLPSRGLFDVLGGERALKDCLFIDQASDAHVLAPGDTSAGGAAIAQLGKVLDALENSYDFLILDCGDAGIDGLRRVADEDTVVLLPVNGETIEPGRSVERRLKSVGLGETIMVRNSGPSITRSAA
ncbi:MAG: exopolysaccharide transport family protein [Nitratireductor sp.]|nr:exopolysaccharide transport family protein [Nitratireductor sp.]